MSFGDPSTSLLAASGNDTVKLFDPSAEPSDPCMLSYTPSPGCPVNSVKWNHTNVVVASAGEDKKISLWRKNGQSMGTIPVGGIDNGDGIEESILAINFSHKGSRYICSGGSGQVVRIWDLQRKRCIKWLRGHTDTITGAMYNYKDEHLASISLNGDLILHNLASGVKATELKDPNQQVLRVLDYSRISRHLLVTAGDDGSAHLWDTTGRSPKVSWLKQHSAPAVGIGFSPSNDKVIASIGMDKKLYFYDSGSKRPSSCIPYEAPFSSMAYREDGRVLAAGTSNGRVVFYDVRGKPRPYTVIQAYSSSEAVTSLCWQKSKPVVVNENNCTAEAALLGGAVEDSILMPDPLPSVRSSSLSLSTTLPSLQNPGHSGSSAESYSLSTSSGGSISGMLYSSTADETPQRGHLWPGGRLSRLQAPLSNLNFKDDMEVFSPLVDVQPVTPSLDNLWDEREEMKRDHLAADKKPSSLLFPSSNRRFPSKEDGADDHPIFDWKSSLSSKQDDNRSSFAMLGSTPTPSSRSEDSSVTPPEAWGGEKISDKLNHLRQSVNFPSRFGMASGSILSGLQDLTSHSSISSLENSNFTYANLRSKDPSMNQETTMAGSEHVPFSSTLSLTAKGLTTQSTLDLPGPTPLSMPRRLSTYAERIGTNPSFSDGTSLLTSSPKTKKTGAESREELLNSLLSRSDGSGVADSGNLPVINGTTTQSQKAIAQTDSLQGSSFTHQLFQCTLDETLGTFQKSIHEDLRNLHIEILRQFHIQEMETASVMKSILENQAELMKEVQSLRKENQQLRQLL